ncbi:hypothetical protein SOCEGT47_079250 [Sorangium cellulosum]|uniref:Zinc finger/thioredoxin putative domain-containing protein n=1 Tax=Sorangium cellulosum TaxID=56 RepID=A0A4P2QD81_SORCE|nr:zinc-ribbon domain-containing protein [Sorangium cellulosum]AUX27338.1 hypothetical protein SOCEGT47_079250 [Sorangium cellulosum]
MDVTCERCSTEYEFDDALVSERGTTVKCTNCGYQFKVRRSDGALPERWVVRTLGGRELEFTMLRELQAAISQGQITRDDVISRGNARPRRLGSIAELEPFFKGPGSMIMAGTALGIGGPAPVPGRSRSQTPQGLGGPAPAQTEGSVAIPLPRAEDGAGLAPGAIHEAETVVRDVRDVQSGRERPAARRAALPGVVVPPEEAPPLPDGHPARRPDPRALRGGRGAEGRQGNVMSAAGGAGEAEGLSPPRIQGHVPPRVGPAAGPAAADDDEADGPVARRGAALRAPGEERAAPRRSGARSPLGMPAEPEGRSFYADDDGDTRITALSTRRTGIARWVVGLIVAGLAVVTAATLGPKYLQRVPQARPVTSDDRVPTLVGEGERSLSEGDLETARDKLVKASALAEDDPRVAAGLAVIDTVSADMRWLRLQLLAPDDPARDATRHELQVATDRARKAVDHARRVAPADPAVTRAAIDLLRVQGDVPSARKLVGAISAESAQPENALTLAALDLAEAQPSWAAVVDRLRAAASSERIPGRARALLVYALARSGDLAAARAENERLLAMSRPHPLAHALRAFLDRLDKAEGKPSGDAAPAPGGRPQGPAPAGAPGPGPSATPATPAPTPAPRRIRRAPAPDDGRVPDDYVAPGGIIDTSDLPGIHPPSPPSTTAPEIDTSDLPGINDE